MLLSVNKKKQTKKQNKTKKKTTDISFVFRPYMSLSVKRNSSETIGNVTKYFYSTSVHKYKFDVPCLSIFIHATFYFCFTSGDHIVLFSLLPLSVVDTVYE